MIAVLGVDPGVRGGMALVRADGSLAETWGFSPGMVTEGLRDVLRTAVKELRLHGSDIVFLEKVGYMPTDGGQGAFTFGRVSGMLEMGLASLDLRPKHVYPVMWQGFLGCLSAGNKNVTKAKARELFPGAKIVHGTADAILIAEYGRRRLAL